MQIGPRIRVKGGLGKLGQKAKIGVGKLASKAAPIVSFFNPALGTALALGGDVLDTSDGSFDPVKAGRKAALTYGVGKAVNKFGGPLLKKVGIGTGAASKTAGATDDLTEAWSRGELANAAAATAGGVDDTAGMWASGQMGSAASAAPSSADPSRFRRVTSGVGDFIGKHKDSIIDYGAAAEGLYDRNRERGFQDEARDDWRRRRALRDRSQALLLDEERPDLSGITADPNLRYRRVSAGGY